jgi:hypothetical protein
MSQPRHDRQDDLFRASLEAIINLRHPLVRLAAEIDWDFLAKRFSSVCRLGPGQPPLPTRLVAGLFITVSAALPLEAAEVAASRHSRSYSHSRHHIRRPALVFGRTVVVQHFPCRRHRTSPN